MTNKKIKRATGNYTQELVNNQPVVPTVPVQNPTIATGGNSYQAYVNDGAPTTPVQMRSVVTPVQNPTVQMEGQYTRNLVMPKRLKNEVGGKELEVEEFPSYLETLKEREESIVDQYNADINYAEQLKDEANKKAEDQYGIAMREAQGNFRANQPTYGAKAEQLLASGLTGGGYSDYLGGKAYEARTDEINAARSQMSYAQQLADSNYRDMMKQANTDKYNQQAALDQWKLEYGVQLDAEYKAKVDEVLMEIKNGDINATVAETKLKNYAPNGEISESVLNALKTQEEEYWRNNNNSITTDFISWVAARQDAEKPVNAAGMRQWLKDNTNLTDNEVEFWIATYTDEDGNYQPPTNISYEVRNGNLWISTDGGKTWKDYGAIGDNGGQGGDNPDNGGQGGDNPDNGDDDDQPIIEPPDSGSYDKTQTYDKILEAATGGNKATLNSIISDVENLVNEGKADAGALEAIKNIQEGLVITKNGKLAENKGLFKDYRKGENFTVNVGDIVYRVQSGGEADTSVKKASQMVSDGVVFGYGSDLYLKVGNTAYKIEPRMLFGKADYDKLWGDVYTQAITNAKNDIPVANVETDNAIKLTQSKNAMFKDDAAGPNKSLGKGDNFNITVNEKTYKVQSGGETKNQDIIAAAKAAGVQDREVFTYGDQAYLKKDGKIYEIESRLLSPGTETKLANAIEGEAGATIIRGTGAEFKGDALGARKDLSAGDNFNITVNEKTYRVESGGKIDYKPLIDAFASAKIRDNEVFAYGDQLYLKKGDNYYMINTRFWHPGAENNALEALKSSVYVPSEKIAGLSGQVESNGTQLPRFSPMDDGTALFLLGEDNSITLDSENLKSKDVPTGVKKDMNDYSDEIVVAYQEGTYYLCYHDGSSYKFYKITPQNENDKALLDEAIGNNNKE